MSEEIVITTLEGYDLALNEGVTIKKMRENYLDKCVGLIFANVDKVNYIGNVTYDYAPPVIETGENCTIMTVDGTVPTVMQKGLHVPPSHLSEEQCRRYCIKRVNYYKGTTTAKDCLIFVKRKDGSYGFDHIDGPFSFEKRDYLEFETVAGFWTRNTDSEKYNIEKSYHPPNAAGSYKTHQGKDYVEQTGDLLCGLCPRNADQTVRLKKLSRWFNCSRQWFHLLAYLSDENEDTDGSRERQAFKGSHLVTNSWERWLSAQKDNGVEITKELLEEHEKFARTNEPRFRIMTTEEPSIFGIHSYCAIAFILKHGRYPDGEFIPNNIAGRRSVAPPGNLLKSWKIPPGLLEYLEDTWGFKRGNPIQIENPYDKVVVHVVEGMEVPYPEVERRRRVNRARGKQ